jgi:hypothetical protein
MNESSSWGARNDGQPPMTQGSDGRDRKGRAKAEVTRLDLGFEILEVERFFAFRLLKRTLRDAGI